MSNYWDIECLTCKAHHTSSWCFGLLGNYRINHGESYLAEMILNRQRLETVAEQLEGLTCLTVEFSAAFGSHPFSVAFFREHKGHELAVVSEYGYRFADCSEYLTCGACGERHMCKLPRGHEGPHSKDRPA